MADTAAPKQNQPVAGNKATGDDLWTEEEVATLKAAYFADLDRREIDGRLPNKTYAAISMKMHRLGLPSRKVKRRAVEDQIKDLDMLLADDPLQAGYQFLDHGFSRDDVLEAYRPPPPPELEERPCKNCRRMTIFSTRYQLWCDTCRKQMQALA